MSRDVNCVERDVESVVFDEILQEVQRRVGETFLEFFHLQHIAEKTALCQSQRFSSHDLNFVEFNTKPEENKVK